MKKLFCCLPAFAALTALAVPRVDLDDVTVDNENGKLTVCYRLQGGPGIVTMSVQTNAGNGVWITVSGALVKTVSGDANCYVATTGTKSAVWKAYRDWKGTKLGPDMIRVVLKAYERNAGPDYMAVDLTKTGNGSVSYFEDETALPLPPTDRIWKTDRLLFKRIRAAFDEFHAGHAVGELGSDNPGFSWTPETPRRVTLTRDYYIGVYPVTQAQWTRLGGTNTSTHKVACADCAETADDVALRPVESVSYANVATSSSSAIVMLRERTGCNDFALPTAAEWEYACRAGCAHAYYNGTELETWNGQQVSENLKPIAWHGGSNDGANGHTHTHAVGRLEPNAFGLYDMLGNVMEFTRDYFPGDPGSADRVDQSWPNVVEQNAHTVCGGHFDIGAYRCRACCWNYGYENGAAVVGFRVICY